MRILFICHGNICRSPMAEMIFKNLADKAGLRDAFRCFSAAISNDEIGNDIYPPAKRILRQKGVPFTPHRAHLVTKAEMEGSDLVIIMDEENRGRLHYLFGSSFDAKTHLKQWGAIRTRLKLDLLPFLCVTVLDGRQPARVRCLDKVQNLCV